MPGNTHRQNSSFLHHSGAAAPLNPNTNELTAAGLGRVFLNVAACMY